MRSHIHLQARTILKIRQKIKDSNLSDREATKVFNITSATAAKWLKRDDVQNRSHRPHTLYTTLSTAQKAIVRHHHSLLPLDDLLYITGNTSILTFRARALPVCSNTKARPASAMFLPLCLLKNSANKAGGLKQEFPLLTVHLIEHRLVPPLHPQTNGMIERFNDRISELLQQTRFESRADLGATLLNHLKLYNHDSPQRAIGALSI